SRPSRSSANARRAESHSFGSSNAGTAVTLMLSPPKSSTSNPNRARASAFEISADRSAGGTIGADFEGRGPRSIRIRGGRLRRRQHQGHGGAGVARSERV